MSKGFVCTTQPRPTYVCVCMYVFLCVYIYIITFLFNICLDCIYNIIFCIYILLIVYFLRIPISLLRHLLFLSFSTFMTCPLFLFYCYLIIVEATVLGMTKYLFNLIYSLPPCVAFPTLKKSWGTIYLTLPYLLSLFCLNQIKI